MSDEFDAEVDRDHRVTTIPVAKDTAEKAITEIVEKTGIREGAVRVEEVADER